MRALEPTIIPQDRPMLIDPDDEAQLTAVAEELCTSPEEIADAVSAVGPNRKAVELFVSLPFA